MEETLRIFISGIVYLYDIVYECPHIKAAVASRSSSERGLPGWPLLPFVSEAATAGASRRPKQVVYLYTNGCLQRGSLRASVVVHHDFVRCATMLAG